MTWTSSLPPIDRNRHLQVIVSRQLHFSSQTTPTAKRIPRKHKQEHQNHDSADGIFVTFFVIFETSSLVYPWHPLSRPLPSPHFSTRVPDVISYKTSWYSSHCSHRNLDRKTCPSPKHPLTIRTHPIMLPSSYEMIPLRTMHGYHNVLSCETETVKLK